jgi:hypothetical protein
MYVRVVDENKELKRRLVSRKLERVSLQSFAIAPAVAPSIAPDRRSGGQDFSVVNAYLRTTLVQFFAQDADRRGELVKLILELVGCTPQQVAAAQRQWTRSNQLIQKTTGFFGF